MAVVTIECFRLHDFTSTQLTRVTAAIDSCSFDFTLIDTPIDVYFGQTPLLPSGGRSWGYSYTSTHMIKMNPNITAYQTKYTFLHEFAHHVDAQTFGDSDRRAIKEYLRPHGDYYAFWGKGNSTTTVPYRWRASEGFADSFARRLYSNYTNTLVDYYHREVDPADVDAVTALVDFATGSGGQTDPDPEPDPIPPDPLQDGGESGDSGSNIATGILLYSDVWMLIGSDRTTAHTLVLPVTDENHERVIQKEQFETLGSDRKLIIRGFVLGHEGSLTCIFDGSKQTLGEDGETLVPETIRGRNLVEYLAANHGPHTLKNPFGESWEVDFDNPKFKWLHGGHLQVDLSWVETGQPISEINV